MRKMPNRKLGIVREWMFEHRYPVFLGSLMLFFILPDILGVLFNVEVSFMTLFSIVVLASVFLVHISERGFVLQIGLVFFLVILELITSRMQNNRHVNLILFLLLGIYFLAITVFLFKDLFNRKTVTWQVIVGAFTGYFLIGVLGFFLLSFIEFADPGSLSVGIESARDVRDIFYFAFITMTTIGYGDIAPVSDSARSSVILIGLVGQFYLAIVMAIMVGKFLSQPISSNDSDIN
jgi:cobalt/nickel transport system permease protein